MSESVLRLALERAGVICEVEAEDRLVLLRVHGDSGALADGALRGTVTRLAVEHGYTHVALELPVVAPER